MQNKDKGDLNTDCTFKWHLVFWVTIGSITNLHLTLIYLFSVVQFVVPVHLNKAQCRDSKALQIATQIWCRSVWFLATLLPVPTLNLYWIFFRIIVSSASDQLFFEERVDTYIAKHSVNNGEEAALRIKLLAVYSNFYLLIGFKNECWCLDHLRIFDKMLEMQ